MFFYLPNKRTCTIFMKMTKIEFLIGVFNEQKLKIFQVRLFGALQYVQCHVFNFR